MLLVICVQNEKFDGLVALKPDPRVVLNDGRSGVTVCVHT